MSEQLFKHAFEQTRQLAEINHEIIDQNERHFLTNAISDEDFQALTISGLANEQQTTVERRDELASQLDYLAIMDEWDGLETEASQADLEKQALEDKIAIVTEQAALSIEIAPALNDAIQALADDKISVIHEDIAKLEASRSEATEKELGYTAIFAPWPIPVMAAGQAPTSEHGRVSIAVSEETIAKESLKNVRGLKTVDDVEKQASLKPVMWAVYDAVSRADGEGIRMEEMRSSVPELTELDSEDYKYFKSHFEEMRRAFEEELSSMGVNIEWVRSGQARGTRYSIEETPTKHAVAHRVTLSTVRLSTPSTEPPQQKVPTSHTAPAKPDLPTQTDTVRESIPSTAQSTRTEPGLQDELRHASAGTAESVHPEEAEAEKTMVLFAKVTGGRGFGGVSAIEECSIDEVAKLLRVGRDPQYKKQLERWIEWLNENPQSHATRKIRSTPGLRTGQGEPAMPLYRFSPKDAPGLSVPRRYMRQRVVYGLFEGKPVLVGVLDHDSFDRKYN